MATAGDDRGPGGGPSALYRWYRDTADRHPDAPAMTFIEEGGRSSRSYTFGELFETVEELGRRLRARELGRSAPVGVLLASQHDQVLHYLAALEAGTVPAILTPPNRKLNREYYLETMSTVLRRCGFGAVVVDIDGIDLPSRGLAPFTFEELPAPAAGAGVVGAPLDASFMQFSSGTTGIKRGVLVTDEAVTAQLRTYADALGVTTDDRIVSWLPLYHDMGFIACLNMPLALGVHTVMIDPIEWVTDPAIYLRAVARHGGTLSWHPNFAYAFMAQRVRDRELDGVDLSSLRALVNCSEPVTQESQQLFLDRFAGHGLSDDVFTGCYAMAETTFALTHGSSAAPGYLDERGPVGGVRAREGARFVSVGRPLPGVELAVVEPDRHEPLPDGTVGELWVRSPFNFSGYFNEPDATSRAFVDGWYRTGDLGYRKGEHYYVAGRLKDVLIVGGVNVFPQDIEDLVSSVDGVQSGRVSAFSTFDPRVQTERIVILAEPSGTTPVDRPQLVQEIRQHVLASFQIANFELHLVEPGWLVKSSSGKMARGANRDKWLEERDASGTASRSPSRR
jgi:fatty-acyl-CoA synthase